MTGLENVLEEKRSFEVSLKEEQSPCLDIRVLCVSLPLRFCLRILVSDL
jgi:hypothetical protein